MKAYIISIGEKTTQICCEQMERYGYDVVLLDQKESIVNKYKRFILQADGNCIKIDADIIPNINIIEIKNIYNNENFIMAQFQYYDLYKNNIGVGNPIYYGQDVIQIIRNNLDKISSDRPETSAWRLPEIIDYTHTSNIITGIHGFFQSKEDVKRAEQNKKDRRQIQHFDFELVNKLYKLNESL